MATPGPEETVWITGASSGLGAALVREYRDHGYRVIATARPSERLDRLVAEDATRVRARPADVTDRDALRALVEQICAAGELPTLSILNAGTYAPMGAADLDGEACRSLFALNVFSVIDTFEMLLPALRAQGHGRIAVVGSVAADIGLPYAGPYAASKAALVRLCQSLRPELERDGIGLSLIEPGFVRTPLTAKNDFPMPFMVEAPAAARFIRRRLASGARTIRFPLAMSLLMRLLAALPDAVSLRLRTRMLR